MIQSVIETGMYDSNGIPIYAGDLIRVFHYTHIRHRRKMWLYFRVAKKGEKFVVQNWNNLDSSKHQCLLEDVGKIIEVVAESGIHRNDNGEIITFNERKRGQA